MRWKPTCPQQPVVIRQPDYTAEVAIESVCDCFKRGGSGSPFLFLENQPTPLGKYLLDDKSTRHLQDDTRVSSCFYAINVSVVGIARSAISMEDTQEA